MYGTDELCADKIVFLEQMRTVITKHNQASEITAKLINPSLESNSEDWVSISMEEIDDTIEKYQTKMGELSEKYFTSLLEDVDDVINQNKFSEERADKMKDSVIRSKVHANNAQSNPIEITSSKIYNYLLIENETTATAYIQNLKANTKITEQMLNEAITIVNSNVGKISELGKSANPNVKLFSQLYDSLSKILKGKVVKDETHFITTGPKIIGKGKFVLKTPRLSNGLTKVPTGSVIFDNGENTAGNTVKFTALTKEESVAVCDAIKVYTNRTVNAYKKVKPVITKLKEVADELSKVKSTSEETATSIKLCLNLVNMQASIFRMLLKHHNSVQVSAYKYLSESYKLFSQPREVEAKVGAGQQKLEDVFNK